MNKEYESLKRLPKSDKSTFKIKLNDEIWQGMILYAIFKIVIYRAD